MKFQHLFDSSEMKPVCLLHVTLARSEQPRVVCHPPSGKRPSRRGRACSSKQSTLIFSQLSRKVWNFQGRISRLTFEGTFIGFSNHCLATLNFQTRGEMYAF